MSSASAEVIMNSISMVVNTDAGRSGCWCSAGVDLVATVLISSPSTVKPALFSFAKTPVAEQQAAAGSMICIGAAFLPPGPGSIRTLCPSGPHTVSYNSPGAPLSHFVLLVTALPGGVSRQSLAGSVARRRSSNTPKEHKPQQTHRPCAQGCYGWSQRVPA